MCRVRASITIIMGHTYRSPLLRALLQSLSLTARSPKLSSPALILASNARMISLASSLVLVISACVSSAPPRLPPPACRCPVCYCCSRRLTCFQELARLLSLCFTRRCEHLILPCGRPAVPSEANGPDVEKLAAMYCFSRSWSVSCGGSHWDCAALALK